MLIGHSFIYSFLLFSFMNQKHLKTKITVITESGYSSFRIDTKLMHCPCSAKLMSLGIHWVRLCVVVGNILQLVKNIYIATQSMYAHV